MINIRRSYYETTHENMVQYYCSSLLSWPRHGKIYKYIEENPDASERHRLNFTLNPDRPGIWVYGKYYWMDCMK